MSLSAAATDFRSFQETKSRLWCSRWTMQVCTVACGKTAVIASGKPLRPSTTATSTSSTPRFFSSVMTRSQNFAPADPARSVSEAAVRDAHRGGLLDPEPEDFLATAGAHAELQVDGLVADRAFVPDLDPERVEEDQRVDRLQRPVPPLGDLVQDRLGDGADQLGRDVEAVELGEVALDLPDREAAGVHRDDPVVEARQPPPVLGDQLRIEGREPIPWHRDRQLAVLGQEGLPAVAVPPIGATLGGLFGQVVVDLGVQRPLGKGALQLVQDAAFGQRRPGVTPREEPLEKLVRDRG